LKNAKYAAVDREQQTRLSNTPTKL